MKFFSEINARNPYNKFFQNVDKQSFPNMSSFFVSSTWAHSFIFVSNSISLDVAGILFVRRPDHSVVAGGEAELFSGANECPEKR